MANVSHPAKLELRHMRAEFYWIREISSLTSHRYHAGRTGTLIVAWNVLTPHVVCAALLNPMTCGPSRPQFCGTKLRSLTIPTPYIKREQLLALGAQHM